MTKIPHISAHDCIRVLNKLGYSVHRQKGSHITLIRDNPSSQVTIPNHKEIAPGTLRAIIRQCGLTVDEFVNLLNLRSM